LGESEQKSDYEQEVEKQNWPVPRGEKQGNNDRDESAEGNEEQEGKKDNGKEIQVSKHYFARKAGHDRQQTRDRERGRTDAGEDERT
jgi:hypothetical protein